MNTLQSGPGRQQMSIRPWNPESACSYHDAPRSSNTWAVVPVHQIRLISYAAWILLTLISACRYLTNRVPSPLIGLMCISSCRCKGCGTCCRCQILATGCYPSRVQTRCALMPGALALIAILSCSVCSGELECAMDSKGPVVSYNRSARVSLATAVLCIQLSCVLSCAEGGNGFIVQP